MLKAGAFRLLSERYNLEKLAPSTHLYTADARPEGFPGKCFEVESVLEWSKASLKELKQTYDRLEMTALNFPLATDALREKLHQQGYPIARRTVAKYREQLGIPIARMRKS